MLDVLEHFSLNIICCLFFHLSTETATSYHLADINSPKEPIPQTNYTARCFSLPSGRKTISLHMQGKQTVLPLVTSFSVVSQWQHCLHLKMHTGEADHFPRKCPTLVNSQAASWTLQSMGSYSAPS